MKISVNGEPLDLESACTLGELLERLELTDRPCAIEVNERIVPRADQGTRTLADGDAVEIVTFVGGG
ncbi:MAG: sulfur carrier protein ThiS [Planctomycetota bacterium]|jgi:thiamine biosynthesis protein ThiS